MAETQSDAYAPFPPEPAPEIELPARPVAGLAHPELLALFHRLSAMALRFMDYDEALVALFNDRGTAVTSVASTRGEVWELSPTEEKWLLDAAVASLELHAFVAVRRNRTWLRAPVRIDGRTAGTIVFFFRAPVDVAERELMLVQWIGDHIGISLSAGWLWRPENHEVRERNRSASVDAVEDLLRELGTVLDIREVFPRVSEIVKRVIPHDNLTMTFHDSDGEVVLHAESGPERKRWRVKVDPAILDRPFVLLPELTLDGLARANHQPLEARHFLAASGYGSFLAVNVRAREQRLGLEFWSKQPFAFSADDVPFARRIADCAALAVSHEQLAETVRTMTEARMRARRLERHVRTLPLPPNGAGGNGRVVGRSVPWNRVLRAASQVAATETTVLLTGESGTGKEVVARVIHRLSARRAGPFVAVNCAALPEQLIESELFGYERGAFTGAYQAKPGQIELASGGVLFLDEVSEMSPAAQAKFLRVLEERQYQRLGGTRVLHAAVRVIAATNCDLQKAIERGSFRRDLYYRLRVFDIRLPPLRTRHDDIIPLSEAFLQELGDGLERPVPVLAPAARALLVAHGWPGNVRELRNVLERAVILCEEGVIGPEHLSLESFDSYPAGSSTDLTIVERETIERVMRECCGNKSEAARRLGLTRMQLYVRLRRYHLD